MMQQKKRVDRRPVRRRDLRPQYTTDSSGALVVDLHIENLIDNTNGMSPADILNRQVDEFCHVMDANLKIKAHALSSSTAREKAYYGPL